MKQIIIATISAMFLCAVAVSCGYVTEKDSMIVNETTTETTTEATTVIETQAETASTAALITTATETITVETGNEDIRTIIKEVCIKYYDSPGYTDQNAERDAEYMIERAREFTEHDSVEVTSEETAVSRARAVFIEYIGQEFVDQLESDYVEKNGETLKLERKSPPYKCVYYDEYDVWAITAVLRSGKPEDGSCLEHTGQSPYVLIRGTDGAVLAAYC